MKPVGFFDEMGLYESNGSFQDHLVESLDYDKGNVIAYLTKQKRLAGCPRKAIDCGTGEVISDSFFVYTDGEYEWCDFLIYHIEKYNIKLPMELIEKAERERIDGYKPNERKWLK